MYSKETINEALEGIDINKEVISFLQNKEEINKLFHTVRKQLFEKNEFYTIQLKENISKFQTSILGNKGHFKYIEKRIIHRKKANFQEYNEDASELKKLKKAYCIFYTEASNYIKTIDSNIIKHQSIKDVLIEFFTSFSKFYCPSVSIR